MEHGNRAVARERRSEMLELVRIGYVVQACNHRHRPIAVGGATDDTSERPPVGEVAGLVVDRKMHRSEATLFEMIAVARCAPRQSGSKRRWAALEIAARSHHAVGIDDDAGVT